MINGNGGSLQLHAFPHVPLKALPRKDAIEAILKRVQKINLVLRYQVRLGEKDLDIMVKNFNKYDYRPYVKVGLDAIDPNGDVPEWDLVSRKTSKATKINP